MRSRSVCVCEPTEHALGDGEGDGGSAGHPPAGGEVGEVRPQHLHHHLVVQGQVELLVVYELGERERERETQGQRERAREREREGGGEQR